MKPAARLQGLPADQAWAIADSNVLQAIANGTPAAFGRRGASLRTMIGALSKAGLVYALLWLVGTLQLARLLTMQHRGAAVTRLSGIETGQRTTAYPPYFFVGFGAGSEENLYARYLAMHPRGVGRVDQINVGSLAAWHTVGTLGAMACLRRALANAKAAMSSLPPEFERWRLDFLTSVGIRIAHYAFMRAWFEEFRQKCADVRELAFLAPDTPAFAAIDAGLPTRYIEHGMVRHSLVLPRFEWVDALTPDEATHFRRRLPSAAIELQPSTGTAIARATMSDGILIASVYVAPVEMQRVSSFVDWATPKGIKVWVRPHPREDRSFWSDEEVRPRVAIEDSDASFNEALARLRPRLVVSWFSTALADALAVGIIPVSVSARDDPNVRDMVYPLFQRCLRWPDDAATITRVLEDDEAYRAEVGRLRLGWEGLPD